MAQFFDNVTWQKVVLIFGSFILLIAAIALLPDEFQRLVDTIKDMFGVVTRFFRDIGGA